MAKNALSIVKDTTSAGLAVFGPLTVTHVPVGLEYRRADTVEEVKEALRQTLADLTPGDPRNCVSVVRESGAYFIYAPAKTGRMDTRSFEIAGTTDHAVTLVMRALGDLEDAQTLNPVGVQPGGITVK
ncbi:hypothetical protein GCM10011360_17330 [Primorskyibacter flagellatus]|uniref:Uncharacterized protein n=1 Tax=Primorskyibacter flagellatus TaxID=1387277 RepID=A0A917A632_9RHOB|nr:hypothetical protein [Primorskyibacter flagellatus]GGE29795.1 hypothetical protein GCM10011360_17330 [Primorskyibacter flagellatus]